MNGVDTVMRACSASLEARTKERRKAFVGGDKTEYRAHRGGAMRSCLVSVSPAWRIRRALRLGYIITRVRDVNLDPAADEAFLSTETTRPYEATQGK
jgi:hypothetical protein